MRAGQCLVISSKKGGHFNERQDTLLSIQEVQCADKKLNAKEQSLPRSC